MSRSHEGRGDKQHIVLGKHLYTKYHKSMTKDKKVTAMIRKFP
jgi:hypothetical protein